MTYGYLRVSTDKQDMNSQKIGIVKKSEELGLAIGEWVSDDGVSGTKEYKERKLGSLMDKLNEGDVLIVSEISRLARSVFMLFRIIEFCNNKKIVIYSVKDSINTIKPNDLSSMMMIFCFGIAAQIEREMIVKRTIEGLERVRAKGVMVGRPFGKKTAEEKIKYKELVPQIQQYIDKGLAAPTIAKELGIGKTAIYRIMVAHNIKNANGNIIRLTKQSKLFAVLDKQKSFIEGLINEGLSQKAICERLSESGFKGSYWTIRNFIASRQFKNSLMQKQKEIRLVKNADCGKQRRYYRF